MSVKIGINGLGRIGRLVFRLAIETPGIELVHLNDMMDTPLMSHLIKYDSLHGKLNADLSCQQDHLVVNGSRILVTHCEKPDAIPWKHTGVDIVIDASGKFKTSTSLQAHLRNGAKKVILTCPALDNSIERTIVMGVNHKEILPSDRIISNASCTTNCVAIMLKVLQDEFGVKKAFMNTIHPLTNNQNIQDGYHTDYRRARSAINNIIPTTSSAIDAIRIIFPEMKDTFDGFATRVPVAECSFVELIAELDKNVEKYIVNQAFLKHSEGNLNAYLEYCSDPIVSSDIHNNRHSAIFDSLATKVLAGDFIQILGWYDNEFGYSARIIDLIKYVS